MKDIQKRIGDAGIVPVIKINDPDKAVPLAKALYDGGLPIAEITFRTSHAKEAIARITAEVPEMLVGAGTVLTTDQVDAAIEAGAKFIVSPGFNQDVVRHCIDRGITVTPGCVTPSDIERAISFGVDVVKFFPAEAYGGVKTIKALSAPYPGIKFIPTGGIDSSNLISYLSHEKVLACGGSWMVKEEFLNNGEFDKIKSLVKEAVDVMLGFEAAHIGINMLSAEEAGEVAGAFERTFGLKVKDGNSSFFAGPNIEVMKSPFLGMHGHIAIGTNSVARAVSYLKRQGVEFMDNTAKYDEKGNLQSIYLKKDAGGFAIHLVQKK